MTQEFRLADIGEGLEEAEIIEWKVAVGDHVQRDQPLVEVMTDKSNAELPAPCDGIVLSVGGAVGDIVEVGALLAVIDDGAQVSAPASKPAPASPPASPSPEAAEASGSSDSASPTISTFQRAAAVPDGQGEPGSDPASTPVAAVADGPTGRPKASPTTRSEAARRGIDMTLIVGTGPGGRILLTDLDQADGAEAPPVAPRATAPAPLTAAQTLPTVEDVLDDDEPVEAPQSPAAATQPELIEPDPVELHLVDDSVDDQQAPASPPAGSDGNVVPLRGIRRVIAQNMARSWSDIPHIHAFAHIDAEPMLDLRAQLKASGRSEFLSLTPLSFFVAAVTAAMEKHPQANASLDLERGEITSHANVNVGVAVAAPTGLVVPVIANAGDQSFPEIASAVRARVDQARAGELTAADFRDGTVTITNFGSLGGEQALPLIRPPESVIFGFGSIALRPFVIEGDVVARKTMNLVIGADHRLLDGDVTTSMLNHIAELLTNPINLVLGD